MRIDECGFGFSFSVRHDVAQVAVVHARWILRAMLLVVRIEMRPGGLEVWSDALSGRVNVNSMITRGNLADVDRNTYAFFRLMEFSVADFLARSVHDVGVRGLSGCG